MSSFRHVAFQAGGDDLQADACPVDQRSRDRMIHCKHLTLRCQRENMSAGTRICIASFMRAHFPPCRSLHLRRLQQNARGDSQSVFMESLFIARREFPSDPEIFISEV
jgi:hypothetical protein